MAITYPVLMPMAWASGVGANVGTLNSISQSSAAPNNVSLNDGIPAQQMTSGGVPTQGGDMNGILNWITSFQTWVNAGGLFRYNSTLSGSIGGYPAGSLLVSTSLNQTYFCNNASPVNPNPNNPDSSMAGWQYAYGNIVGTGANVGGSSATDGTMYWSNSLGLCLQGKGATTQFSLMTPSSSAALMQMTSSALYFPVAPTFTQKALFTPYTNSTPNVGEVWFDTTQQTLCVEEGISTNKLKVYKSGVSSVISAGVNVVPLTLGSTLYDILAPAKMSNTTTFPANFFVPGKTIKLEMHIYMSFANATTIQFPITLGGPVITASYVASGASTQYTKLEATITCLTAGSSGQFFIGVSLLTNNGSTTNTPFYTVSFPTLNTTTALLLDAQASVTITGCSVSVYSAIVSVLG